LHLKFISLVFNTLIYAEIGYRTNGKFQFDFKLKKQPKKRFKRRFITKN